jgi:hypothetical protein
MGAAAVWPKNDLRNERGCSPVVATQQAPQVGSNAAARGSNRFAFVLHPLTIDYLAKHPRYSWTRHLPRGLVESGAAYMPASLWAGPRGAARPRRDNPSTA